MISIRSKLSYWLEIPYFLNQGPTENKKSVYIPVIDACSELPALAKKIASELKSQAAAASAASVTSATPAKTTPETEVNVVIFNNFSITVEVFIYIPLAIIRE